jgi:hypothetical protein
MSTLSRIGGRCGGVPSTSSNETKRRRRQTGATNRRPPARSAVRGVRGWRRDAPAIASMTCMAPPSGLVTEMNCMGADVWMSVTAEVVVADVLSGLVVIHQRHNHIDDLDLSADIKRHRNGSSAPPFCGRHLHERQRDTIRNRKFAGMATAHVRRRRTWP